MNQDGGSIVWNLDVDSKKFDAGMSDAKQKSADTANDVEKSFSGMSKGIVSAFKKAESASFAFARVLGTIGGAIAGGLGFGVKVAAEVETARQGFKTLLGSVEAADKAIDTIRKDAAQTPFEFTGLVRANQLLTSVTKDSGKSEKILLNVGKALSAAGKGGEELDNVIVNLQQIANTGKISEIDIRQFGFAGINILELLADQYGVTKDVAADMVKNSDDAFGDLEKAFERAGEGSGKFAGAFKDQAGTFTQLFSNFKDVVAQTAGEIAVNTGAFDAVKNALGGIVDNLVRFQPQITEGIQNVIRIITENGPIATGILLGGLAAAFTVLAGAIGGAVLALAPFLIIGASIGEAVQGLLYIWNNNWFGIQEKTQSVVSWFLAYVVPGFQNAFNFIGSVVKTFGQIFINVWNLMVFPMFQSIVKALDDLGVNWGGIFEGMGKIVFVIMDAIISKVKSSINSVISFINAVIGGANLAGSKIPNYVKIDTIPMLADGVRNFGGGLAVVGERGAELVDLPRGANVHSNRESKDILSKGVEINIAQMVVRDQSDIESIGRELGFRIQTSPGFVENG